MNLFESPLSWELAGWLAFLILGGFFIKSDYQGKVSRKEQLGLLCSLLGLLFLKRLLVLFINRELNPDESQLLSQAITLRHHPVYWKSVDGATMGPLSCYYVALPGYFGIPLNYMVLRWVSFLCMGVSLISGYFTLENFFSARVARLALLPAVAFLAFTTNWDFLHATNEQLSLALIGLALWQYSRLWHQNYFDSAPGLFCLSFLCSLVPFAKLQGTPTVLVIVATALLGLVQQYPKMPRLLFWRSLSGLILGGLAFPLLVVLFTLAFGVFDDFIHFYIVGNFAYSAGAGFWYYLGQFPAFVGRTTDFLVYLLPTFALVASWALLSRKFDGTKNLLLFILALLAASGYAIIKPGNEFTHYLLYLVLPISLLNGWLLTSFRAPVYTVFWVTFVIASIAINGLYQANSSANNPVLAYQDASRRQFYISPASQKVLELARRGEDLVVWGWAPQYNVETQMPQGVCDNHVIRLVMGNDRQTHRARYMRNIIASRPPVFLDAVGPNSTWLNDRVKYGYETFPELKNFINTYYRFVGEIDNTRVFARLDRYKN
ncbi:hypothetical protein [Spirosoma sp. KNUC1025]|uniref:hypothetical protein n=1 Tax=Spirosoma sp. KNUC1025 TaxID=2894082 RepID=UPI00386407CD|nr:hypothetical protein LN737_04955 [Spirosoma sp. KNUC1025]